MQTQANKILNPLGYHLSKHAETYLRWLYILYYKNNSNVARASNNIGVSRGWLGAIKNKFEKNNKDPRCLEPLGKAPHHTQSRNRIPLSIEEAIIAVRNKYPWGKEKIASHLKRKHGIIVGASTINRYLHKHHKINPRISQRNYASWQRKRQREQQPQAILKVKHRPSKHLKDYAPGALVEKDMKFVLKQGKFSNTEKYKAKENFYYQHTEIDSFTRIRTLELVKTADSKTASVAHRRAQKRFPFPVASYNTDNGGENEKEFSKELQDTTTFHFYSNAGVPTDNPRVERSHRTDEDEYYKQGNLYKTYDEQKVTIRQWEHTYNYIRPHQALGYLTPMEFYELWKENREEAYRIKNQYQQYLYQQRKRLAMARRIKKKEQIDALMNFIDAKLASKNNLYEQKQSLINCQLCSWT